MAGAGGLSVFFLRELRLGEFLVKLVDPPGGVDKFHLARKERVGLAGDLKLHQWIFLAIFPDNGVFGIRAGLGQKGEITGEILENHVAVIGWMDVFFHDA